MKFLKYIYGSALMATVALAFASCSDDEASSKLSPAVVPSSITLNLPDDLQKLVYTDANGASCLPLIKGQQVTLPYTLTPDSATFKDVTWSSSNTDVATVDDNGTVTAVNGNDYSLIEVAPVGIYAGSGINASLKVVVANEMIKATSVNITSSKDEVYAGDTLHLSASILPNNSTYKTVQWSSSDESVATIDANGVLTAKTSSKIITPVTITATTYDGSEVTGTKTINVRQIVQPQDISLDQTYSADNNYLFALNEKSVDLKYTTTPAECTTSLIQWTSSDNSIATVDNGTVTFKGFGTVTITATCPETGKSSSIKLNIPAGLLRETFHNENNFMFMTSDKTNYVWHNGYLAITTKATNATTQRMDIKCQGISESNPLILHFGKYPILAIKMDDVKDKGATSRNINLDSKAKDSNGTEYKGLLGGNNKYAHELKCSDGSHVFIYDFSTTKAPTDDVLKYSLFQFKYADMKGLTSPVTYNLYWVNTFKSVTEVENYVKNVDGLSYTTVK